MEELVPIKIKIGLRPNGHADHPDWYKLPLAASENPASHMFFGWKYDKTSGHKEESVDSPYGMQWGMVMVSRQFADEALATFPDLVTELNEQQAEDFWDNKAHAHLPDNYVDNDLLQSLKNELFLKKELGDDVTELKDKIRKALDPNDKEAGIKKNNIKKFQDAKVSIGFKIKKN